MTIKIRSSIKKLAQRHGNWLNQSILETLEARWCAEVTTRAAGAKLRLQKRANAVFFFFFFSPLLSFAFSHCKLCASCTSNHFRALLYSPRALNLYKVIMWFSMTLNNFSIRTVCLSSLVQKLIKSIYIIIRPLLTISPLYHVPLTV